VSKIYATTRIKQTKYCWNSFLWGYRILFFQQITFMKLNMKMSIILVVLKIHTE